MATTSNKLKIEIWSDIMCPFCYLGKRKFEKALADFPHREMVETEWKSFQLMPDMKTEPSKSINEFLAEKKGISLEQAQDMNAYVTQAAKQVGLEYNFDKAVVANSMKAHNLLHFAKAQDRQNEAEEQVFAAYFTEGKNIDDTPTLMAIAEEMGLATEGLSAVLENEEYADDIHQDIYEAQQVGVSGVPFFVFNNKYTVSGAQETKVFAQVLQETYAEWIKKNTK